MFGYVTDEQFAKLQKRWEVTDTSLLDPRILETVVRLGKHPDIVPVWSCSGHDGSEQQKKKPLKKTVTMLQARYITFAVREGHTQIFKNFDTYLKNLSYEDYVKARPRLSFFSLNYGFVDSNYDLTTFSVWKVEIVFKLHSDTYCKEYAINPNWLEFLWANLINSMVEGS